MSNPSKVNARERILRAAYELFSHRGVRDVSVDEIIRESNVAIATFYRQFSSKDELVAAFLNRREQLWTLDTIVSQAKARDADPVEQVLAIFDIFDDWFNSDNFEGDSFVNVLIEMGPDHPLGRASISHLDAVRDAVRDLAERAELTDPPSFARSFQILMKGAIIAATMGDLSAARRSREMATWLIEHHRAAQELSAG